MAGILAAWDEVAPQFERLVGPIGAWPAVIDIASHEHDIRGPVRRPGARDAEVVWQSAGWLLTRLRPPLPLRVAVEDADLRAWPPGTSSSSRAPVMLQRPGPIHALERRRPRHGSRSVTQRG